MRTSSISRCIAVHRSVLQPHLHRRIQPYIRLWYDVATRTCSSESIPRPGVLTILQQRGLIKDITGDIGSLNTALNGRQIGIYAGIDPTAASLHLGHMLPLMVLFWFYIHGHHTISLIGGATAQVGDPSGRLVSRARADVNLQSSNADALHKQVETIWERAELYARRHGYEKRDGWRRSLLNNAEWLMKLNLIDFLRMLGSGLRVGAMLGRDTVKNKMEKGDGMSFAEFTYPLLQGWDWWHMFQHYDVRIQVGGSDQYGNIVAGIEAVKHCAISDAEAVSLKKQDNTPPMGITTPLLTTSSGEKFGKSTGNAVWLDATMTSPFDLYGFLLRTSDQDVEQYLNLFTFVPLETITSTMMQQQQAPEQRQAQHLLAYEVCELVHGQEQAIRTANSHKASRQLSMSALLSTEAGRDAPKQEERILLPRSLVAQSSFSKLLYHAGLVKTRSEGARIVKSGGLYAATTRGIDELGFVQVDHGTDVSTSMNGDILVLRLGKWKIRMLEIIEDDAFDDRGLHAPGWSEWKSAHE